MKMLEIGLGCNMHYEPGASASLWRKLFPDAESWEVVYDINCVENAKGEEKLDGLNLLTGDQMNISTLHAWINKTGANFDIVIDDGSYQQCQMWTTF